MSERNHSPSDHSPQTNSNTDNTPTGLSRRWLSVIAGTACLLLTTAVVFQFLRAESGQAQTRLQADAGTSSTSANYLGRVNNQPITYDQVAQECVARHGADVLDSLMNRMIIQQECEKQGITVLESEVKQEVLSIAGKFNLPLDSWYQMLQAERDITPDQYHRDIIWPMIALKKLAGQDVTVTEEDMRLAFERDYGPRVEVRAIFLDGNIRQADKIWNEVQADSDNFDAFARKYSSDSNSRGLGGVVPPIRRSGSDSAVETAAYKLQKGEISGLIPSGRENQYVILKCEGHTEPVVTDVQDVWAELHATLVEEKTQQAVAQIFEKLKDRAEVINYLTQQSSVGPRPGKVSLGNTRQPNDERPATAIR